MISAAYSFDSMSSHFQSKSAPGKYYTLIGYPAMTSYGRTTLIGYLAVMSYGRTILIGYPAVTSYGRTGLKPELVSWCQTSGEFTSAFRKPVLEHTIQPLALVVFHNTVIFRWEFSWNSLFEYPQNTYSVRLRSLVTWCPASTDGPSL